MTPHKHAPGLDIDGFGQLPVLVGGRVMPMDTLARISLSVMNHHGTCTVDGKVQPASRWLLDVLMMPRRADAAKVFEVTNPDILGLFGRQATDGKPVCYSYNDCEPFLSEIGKQAGLAAQTPRRFADLPSVEEQYSGGGFTRFRKRVAGFQPGASTRDASHSRSRGKPAF
jgi:hypothetical protein